MNRHARGAFILALVCTSLTGCLGLKPKEETTRVFILTPISAATAPPLENQQGLAVGFRVTLPDYLVTGSLALRRGANEIVYSDLHRWAESLDRAVRRVVGRNLKGMLSTDRIFLDGWSRKNVDCELHLDIDAFEAAPSGEVNLEGHWQLKSPGGEELLDSGRASITRAGPPPATAMEGTVSTMSEVLGELSRQLAESVRVHHARQ